MESQTVTLLLFVLNFLLIIIMALIGFIVKGLWERIADIEREMKEMKGNYIDRFATVVQAINDVNASGEARHAELKELIISQKTQCAVHELKIGTLEQAQPKKRGAK